MTAAVRLLLRLGRGSFVPRKPCGAGGAGAAARGAVPCGTRRGCSGDQTRRLFRDALARWASTSAKLSALDYAAPLPAQEPPPPKGQKRISKQERRVMIEEFVEKYRASNEGKFPTITCVRQQIGGSHYTVREVVQELEYNNANPLLANAKKSAQGPVTIDSKHSRSTDVSEAAQVQESAQFAEHSLPKDDNGKNQDNYGALKNDEQDDVLLSLKDATTGTTTIEKNEIQRSMGSSDSIVETEAAKPDFSVSEDQTENDCLKDLPVVEIEAARPEFVISDSIKNADDPNLSNQTQNDSVKDLMKQPAVSLGLEAKSDLGKQEGGTGVKKLDLDDTRNSLNASESTVSAQSGSHKLLKRNVPDSEHGPRHEKKGSTETGLIGSLKSLAYGIKNFWKNL